MADRPSRDELQTMLLWGAVGGILPTLSKIAGTFGANFDAPPPKFLGVCIALALYGVIGAIVSRAMANPDMKQSLFAGIAAPAIVVGIIAGVTDSNSARTLESSTARTLEKKSSLQFIGSAQAEAGPATPEPQILGLLISIKGEVTINDTIKVSALVASTTVAIKSIRLPKDLDVAAGELGFEVPKNASAVIFTSSTGIQARTPVNADHEFITLSISPRTSVKEDFVWALGGKRVFEVGRMSAKASIGK